ncbi:DUF871 domain-containing protein [Bacillus aquiflavi]|uniref:DUF871 domain-containing protein n=1 Tax=Bacillus aquiflavi TaxID=2672567 RepID=A0A6B3W4W0_9BACI|nr:MupG family TIM beta-alpha barrel fold protein [Bacillus aquiflavi]MBA4538614.1 DUF871 domain-containing protein [Bacillus aquiflavi]NEY82976.1 DUF871 domain-containing protein [Bacillus aquiflavi]UAC49154.1 MupG family TIM beta-alpha barrel fold protein [Bacillus aquiflavi]
MRGISVYLAEQPIHQIESYIRKVRKHGFQSIFTSLHIPEDDHSYYRKRLIDLGELAKSINMELVADISKTSLKKLGLTVKTANELCQWGLTGLRIDYGINAEEIVELSTFMKIALNASTINHLSLEKLVNAGLSLSSVEGWHNFYPRPETGLDREEFHEKNNWLNMKGISVMAFIPGDEQLRGPLFSRLPTLEDHRNMSPFSAYLQLKDMLVDKVLVGDKTISDFALKQFSAFNEGMIILRAKPYTENIDLLQFVSAIHTNRLDLARDCIRSVESRNYAQIGTRDLSPFHTVERPLGAITVDNENYGRYKGELQITKRSLQADKKVNVIGQIVEEDIPLIPFIKGGKQFQIEWV